MRTNCRIGLIENGYLSITKGQFPFMAVIQRNKDNKVQPVLNWKAANNFIEANTRDANVSIEKL